MFKVSELCVTSDDEHVRGNARQVIESERKDVKERRIGGGGSSVFAWHDLPLSGGGTVYDGLSIGKEAEQILGLLHSESEVQFVCLALFCLYVCLSVCLSTCSSSVS